LIGWLIYSGEWCRAWISLVFFTLDTPFDCFLFLQVCEPSRATCKHIQKFMAIVQACLSSVSYVELLV
jgi:hypothetical protein